METETETRTDIQTEPKTQKTWVRYLNGFLQLIVALLMARGALGLYTLNNDFPVDYHPDEGSKIAQISGPEQDRNFNHPLLMLEAANLAKQYFHVPDDDSRKVLLIGRWTSAMLCAAGVFGIAIVGAISYGWAGLLICGFTIMLCPPLLVHAHYFKEDASLLGGIMITMLGARLLMSAKLDLTQVLAAAFMGIGCGLAISGKLVGLGVAAPCLVALLIARFHGWFALPLRIVAFAIFAYATVVVVNYRVVLDWTTFQMVPSAEANMEQEIHHGTEGHASGVSVALPTPNWYCMKITREDMRPHLWAFLAIGLVWWIFNRHRFTRWGIVLLSFFVTFVVELSRNAIPFGRYALPITISAFIIAAAMMARIVYDLWPKHKVVSAVALALSLVAIIGVQYRECAYFDRQFRDDGRQEMREWIAKNVPAGTMVVADRYTALGSAGDPDRFPDQSPINANIRMTTYAGDGAATPADLAQGGVDYVCVADQTYDRFFEGAHGLEGSEDRFDQLQKFYADLLSHQDLLVWSTPPAGSPKSHSYVGQTMQIYHIAKLAGR